MTTEKRFPIPDEIHPNRKKTLQAIYVCTNCKHEGDFIFCPYCGKRRPCPSKKPDDS